MFGLIDLFRYDRYQRNQPTAAGSAPGSAAAEPAKHNLQGSNVPK